MPPLIARATQRRHRGVTTPEAAPVAVNQLYSLSNCTNFTIVNDLIFINPTLKTEFAKF
jgi:hypothetical protein